jgi:hypothetical protein
MLTTAGPIFWQQPNHVDVNAPMMAKPGQEAGITDRRQINVIVTVSRGLIQATNGNAEALSTTTATYHWTHFVLSPLFDLQSSGGTWRNNLFWLY